MLTAVSENEWQVSSSKVKAVKADAADTSKDRVWSSLDRDDSEIPSVTKST